VFPSLQKIEKLKNKEYMRYNYLDLYHYMQG